MGVLKPDQENQAWDTPAWEKNVWLPNLYPIKRENMRYCNSHGRDHLSHLTSWYGCQETDREFTIPRASAQPAFLILMQPMQIAICLSTCLSIYIFLFFAPLAHLPGPSPALGLPCLQADSPASTVPHSHSSSLILKGLKGGISIRGAYSRPPVELALWLLPLRRPPCPTPTPTLVHLYGSPRHLWTLLWPSCSYYVTYMDRLYLLS